VLVVVLLRRLGWVVMVILVEDPVMELELGLMGIKVLV